MLRIEPRTSWPVHAGQALCHKTLSPSSSAYFCCSWYWIFEAFASHSWLPLGAVSSVPLRASLLVIKACIDWPPSVYTTVRQLSSRWQQSFQSKAAMAEPLVPSLHLINWAWQCMLYSQHSGSRHRRTRSSKPSLAVKNLERIKKMLQWENACSACVAHVRPGFEP